MLLKACTCSLSVQPWFFSVGFFWDRLNVHTFNLESGRLYKAGGFSHRADRRVVVISRALFLFLLHNHFITKKI